MIGFFQEHKYFSMHTKTIYLLLLCFSALQGEAQLRDFYDQKTVSNLHLYYSTHSIQETANSNGLNSSAYNFSNSFPSLGFELEKNEAENGGRHHYWRYRIANDIWATIFATLGANLNSIDQGGITSGFFGELGLGWNVLARNKSNFHLGFALGDYILFTNNQEDGLQGWYFGIGPKAGFDQQLTSKLCLQISSSAIYGYPSSKAFRKEPSGGYNENHTDARPFLFSLRTEICATNDLYFAVDYLSPISDNSIKMSRVDFIFGFKY